MRGEGCLDCSTVNEEHSGDISSQRGHLISYRARLCRHSKVGRS